MAKPSEPNLFGISPKPEKSKAVPAPPGVIHKLIGIYRAGYEKRFREPPVIYKRDGKMLKSLVLQFGAAKVETRLRAFLEWTDPFVVDSGFALSVFHASWNRLAARCVQADQPSTGREMSADRTAEYLRSLRPAPLKAVR